MAEVHLYESHSFAIPKGNEHKALTEELECLCWAFVLHFIKAKLLLALMSSESKRKSFSYLPEVFCTQPNTSTMKPILCYWGRRELKKNMWIQVHLKIASCSLPLTLSLKKHITMINFQVAFCYKDSFSIYLLLALLFKGLYCIYSIYCSAWDWDI